MTLLTKIGFISNECVCLHLIKENLVTLFILCFSNILRNNELGLYTVRFCESIRDDFNEFTNNLVIELFFINNDNIIADSKIYIVAQTHIYSD